MINAENIIPKTNQITTTVNSEEHQLNTVSNGTNDYRLRVGKAAIVEGLTEYIEQEIIPSIADVPLQIILYFGVRLLRKDKEQRIISELLNSDIAKLVIQCENDVYDLSDLISTAKESVSHFGRFPVKIPPIKFVSPEEKVITFSAEDIDKLSAAIRRAANI